MIMRWEVRERERDRESERHIDTYRHLLNTGSMRQQAEKNNRFASHLGKPEHLVKGDEAVTVSHQTAKEAVTGQVVGTQIELKLCVCVCVCVCGVPL